MEKWEEKLQREQDRLARRIKDRVERRARLAHENKWDRFQEHWDQGQGPGHAVFVGGIIVAVGTILLLSNLGFIHIQDIWQYWPAILIAFGIGRIVDCRGFGGLIWGGAVAGIGTLILLQNLDLFRVDWNVIWPVLVIAWGAAILFRPMHWRRRWMDGSGVTTNPPAAGSAAQPDGAAEAGAAADAGAASAESARYNYGHIGQPVIRLVAIFGGGRRQVDSQQFRGGQVTAVFGGYQVDLRSAAVADGQPALIEANAVFGGIEIIVPRTWTVEARGAGVFGGFSDETRPPLPQEVTRQQRLIVTGAGVFGGVVVKN